MHSSSLIAGVDGSSIEGARLGDEEEKLVITHLMNTNVCIRGDMPAMECGGIKHAVQNYARPL